MDIKFQTKGDRYFIKASGQQSDLDTKEDSPPTKWKEEYRDDKLILFSTSATRQTDFTIQGEKVFFAKWFDGRSGRIKKGDWTEERVRAVNRIIKGN